MYHGAVLQREGETVADQPVRVAAAAAEAVVAAAEDESNKFKATVKIPKKEKPNDPCSCKSGKKYKKCCMNAHREQVQEFMETNQ